MSYLIASVQCRETLCPAPLHYAALHCVPLPHGSRSLCYQNDDACHKYQPKLNNELLQQCLCVCVCASVHFPEASERLTGMAEQKHCGTSFRFLDLEQEGQDSTYIIWGRLIKIVW